MHVKYVLMGQKINPCEQSLTSYERFSTTRLPSLRAEITGHEICDRHRFEDLCRNLSFSFSVCEVLSYAT